MTEKEKAKAYDEAIERAKKSYGNGITEEIFPELKEDDEKIIRWIIDDIRYNINNEPLNKKNIRYLMTIAKIFPKDFIGALYLSSIEYSWF